MELDLTVKGVDVYHGDQNLSYNDLYNDDVKFVFIKASQGVNMVDPAYLDNYHRAKSVGMLAGAYHFFMPSQDPVTQAQHFLKTAKPVAGDLVHALDIETYGDGVGEKALEYAEYIKEQTGRQVIPYSSDSFYQSYLKTQFPASDYELWIARYGSTSPVTTCRFWQYSEKGDYPNNPPLDSNIFYGSMEKLQELCIK